MKKWFMWLVFIGLNVGVFAANNNYTGAPAVQLVAPQPQVQQYQDTNSNMVISAPATIINSNLFLSSYTATALATLTPMATGQIVWCANCVAANICISTGSAVGSFVAAASTSTTNQVPCK